MFHVAVYVIPVIFVLCLIRKYKEYQWGVCTTNVSLNGKVFLVTGSNSGIGKEVAKFLAERNATVIMACRDVSRGEAAAVEIRKVTDLGTLVLVQLDLSSFQSVKKFCTEVSDIFTHIDGLIINAGVYYPITSNQKTSEGYEMNFGVNYLGHFLLTRLLIGKVLQSPASRIVIVSSGLHEKGTIDVDDLNMEKRKKQLPKLSAKAAYCASKLALVYHSRELAVRLRGTNTTVYTVCPGFTYTNLFRQHRIRWWQYILFFPVALFFMKTPWQGAQTVLHCAIAEGIEDLSGEFFRNCKVSKSKFNFDLEVQKRLWEKSEDLTML